MGAGRDAADQDSFKSQGRVVTGHAYALRVANAYNPNDANGAKIMQTNCHRIDAN